MSVLAAIAVLAILIVVHELGHFFAARAQGIYANRFSIGFGPVLWKYQGPQTEYALRAFPLGGFVGFPDDDPEANDIHPDDPNLLKNRPILDRAIVISAGVIANLIFAYLVMLFQVVTVGVPEAAQPGVLIPQLAAEVSAVTPVAAQQGFQVGDTLFLDGKAFTYSFEPAKSTSVLVARGSSSPAKLDVFRKNPDDGKPEHLNLTPSVNGQGSTGVSLKPTAAMKQGIQPGDVVLAANNQEFDRSLRQQVELRRLIESSPNIPLQLKVRRGDTVQTLTVTPQPAATGEGRIGASLDVSRPIERRRVLCLNAFGIAAENFQQLVNDTIDGFGQLIRKFSQTASQVAGPVAIVAAGAKIAQADAGSLFDFAALISINLAIINILPLPALDGGHLAFLLIEGLRGKPLPNNVQEGVMQTGLMLLLGLGIFLIVRDTANLIQQ
jgi:RIP metalloprotease RseP